ncbi:MAG: T9SS type A sorting domain-containing protein, partial [Flavobacteriaceae bacterium]
IIAPLICFSQTVWDGDNVTFSKSDGADFNQAANQDRITDDVWLTRGSGGGLFNIKNESSYSEGVSPSQTLWAIGETSDNDLVFENFRDFYGLGGNRPPTNTQIVLKLTQGTMQESDDIHIDLTFTSWTGGGGGQNGGGGGFSYTRSTEPNLSTGYIKNTDILLYPNPTTGLVRANQDIISQIRVYDLTGKQLTKSEDSSVNLSAFKNGVYLLQLYRSDTNNWVTKRIIKYQ